METFLTYGLQDLLLFSRETYVVLLGEYLIEWYLLLVIIGVLFLACLQTKRLTFPHKRLNFFITQVLLLSCLIPYYCLFYADINPYAYYFFLLTIAQLALVSYLSICEPNMESYQSVPSFVFLSLVCLITLVPFAIELTMETAPIFLIPFVHPLPTSVLLCAVIVNHKKAKFLLSVIPLTLLSLESLTLLTLDSTTWWVSLMGILLIAALQHKIRQT